MTFTEYVSKIQSFIKTKGKVNFTELLMYSAQFSEQGFCICDLNDVLYNLERQGKIKIQGQTIESLED